MVLLSADEFRVKYLSDAYRAYLPKELKTKDLIGVRFVDYVKGGEDHPSVAMLKRISESGKGEEIRDYMVTNRDGVKFWVDWVGAPIENGTDRSDVLLQLRDVTERKQLEESLKKLNEELEQKVQERTRELSESEAKYRQFFVNSLQNIGIYEMVRDGKGEIIDWVMVDANKALERQLGRSIMTMRGKRVTDLWGVEASADGVARSREIMSSGIGQQFEMDWGGRHYLASYFPIGRNRLAAVGSDITERKEVQRALEENAKVARQRAEELETLMNVVPAAIWVAHDPECRVITGNRAADSFYESEENENVSAGPASGGEWDKTRRFFRDGRELRPEELPMQESATKGVEICNTELEVLLPSGCKIVMLGNAIPLFDDDGIVRGSVSSFLDITHRKKTEEALQESEKRYRSVGELMPFGIWTTDAQGLATYFSPSFAELVGKSEKDILKFGWLETLDPDTVDRTLSEWKRTIESGEFWNYTHRVMGRDGQWHYVLARGVPIRDESGKITSWVGVNVDITEQKRNEENLARSNAELQQFAYVASHDLQEPLRMITAYIGLLNKRCGDELSDQAKGYMAYAVDGAERMRELINDLLQYSRVDTAGKEFSAVNMNRVAENVANTVHVAVKENRGSIVTEPLPTVWGDEMQLTQVLQNLVSNAIKFRGPEDPRIEILSRESAREWIIAVKDNGIGIDPRYQAKLFQMFSRLHTGEKYPGTGIGLAVSKKIIERHRGMIWVESDGKNGSTFFFTIPKTGGWESNE